MLNSATLIPPVSGRFPRSESVFGTGAAAASTMVELLERRSAHPRARCAYTFLSEDGSLATMSIRDVEKRARSIAATLQEICDPGDRVLLVYPPGLDFVPAFLGCIYAEVLPVPATYPKPRRPMPRLLTISRDCGATLALTTSGTLDTLELPRTAPELQQIQWLATDVIPHERAAYWRRPSPRPDDLAFLQYTSGSTSEPKGVMVSHANLLHNLSMIHRAFAIERLHADGIDAGSVWWLPAYHDMGLIGGILGALYNDGRLTMMPPAVFLKRPLLWLKAMSDFKGTVSGGPNFAYEMCVAKTLPEEREGIDLSHWRLAFCGAEPIRAETLERFAEAFAPCGFRREAFYPCYGLAEATLLATGTDGPRTPVVKSVDRGALADHRVEEPDSTSDFAAQQLVGCGGPWLGQELVIVDPDTRLKLPEQRVGEIWIRGGSVAQGYWNRANDTLADFYASTADDPTIRYMRSGDLGFFSDGHLFITGRVKEVIIVRGRNLYPQDIELTVGRAHPALAANTGAAFAVDIDGDERLVTVHEVDRQYRNGDFDDLFRSVRRAVVTEHELDPYAIVLIRQASLPRTTSGKIQRNLCRQQYVAGELNVVAKWVHLNGRAKEAGSGRRTEGAEPQNGSASLPAEASASRPRKEPAFQVPDRPLSAFEIDRMAEQIETWLLEWLVERAGVSAADLDGNRPFAECGLDSLSAVELSQELEDWLHVQLTPIVAWNYPTPASLAKYLAAAAGGGPQAEPAPPTGESQEDFERMLAEIESLTEDDARAELGER